MGPSVSSASQPVRVEWGDLERPCRLCGRPLNSARSIGAALLEKTAARPDPELAENDKKAWVVACMKFLGELGEVVDAAGWELLGAHLACVAELPERERPRSS
jgi:hypothetical protein